MNTDDRQQHIDTLAAAICRLTHPTRWQYKATSSPCDGCTTGALGVWYSTDPAVHDALVAALHANADRARVLAAHADAGWLDDQWRPATKHFVIGYMPESEARRSVEKHGAHWYLERRYLTRWEPTP